MKKEQATWLFPTQVFVISGGASANTLFLENKTCHQIFFDYFNRFVDPMVDILHYKLTHTGWVMLIKTKSEEQICKAYLEQRNKSEKADRTKDLTEVQRMLSEHIRMFLSNFAKRCNSLLGRSGVWVKKKFDKMAITNEVDYARQFELICDLQGCNYHQIKQKYQAKEEEYDEEGMVLKGNDCPHQLRSSIGVYRGIKRLERMPIKLNLVRPFSDVLRKILDQSKNDQNPQNSDPQME